MPGAASDFDFPRYVAERQRLVAEGLERYTPSADTPPPALHEAIRYSLMGGGKRVRPLLCIAAAESAGWTAEAVLPTACALEMIHTFSLIHDDLPAIDDDDYRRGLPTSHRKFGEAIAILAGDALHTLAFTTIATYQESADPACVVEVIRRIAEAAGTLGMVGGQVDDIHFEGRPVDADTLRHIHARKTGALLNASILSGAALSGATEPELSALRRYGDHVGLAFQIVDDILDVTGDDEKLGKQTGSDEKKEKATYPRLFGIDGSVRLAREAADAAIAALDAAPSPMSQRAEPLRAFARYIVEREA